MFLGFLKSKRSLLPLVLLFLIVGLGAAVYEWNRPQIYPGIFNNMILFDNFAVAFSVLSLLSALLIIPLTSPWIKNNDAHTGEYYALFLFSMVGAMMMVSFQNMLMLFIGIEILSIAMYILAGSDKDNVRSNEAGLKYFLMGCFATGILLFGIALIYGASGSFFITDIAIAANTLDAGGSVLMSIGILMLLAGLAFKLGAAPFHFWTPDVYDGSPTIFTTFMATVVKVAGIGAFLRMFSAAFGDNLGDWQPALIGIVLVTLLIGNITAVYQQSFKRMMAYSSISHAGYLLLALAAFTANSDNAIIFYSAAYVVASIAAFAVLMLVSEKRGENGDHFAAFNGLARTNPFLAFAMTVAMCSLAGIPLTGGFFGKFMVFVAAIDAGYLWLVVIAILMAAVGFFYYFRVIIAMYMRDSAGEEIVVPGSYKLVLLITIVLTFVLGIVPGIAAYWL